MTEYFKNLGGGEYALWVIFAMCILAGAAWIFFKDEEEEADPEEIYNKHTHVTIHASFEKADDKDVFAELPVSEVVPEDWTPPNKSVEQAVSAMKKSRATVVPAKADEVDTMEAAAEAPVEKKATKKKGKKKAKKKTAKKKTAKKKSSKKKTAKKKTAKKKSSKKKTAKKKTAKKKTSRGTK